ncbi:MAG: hypothetical protein N3D10_04245, partial [Candidatus Micrarchaeota archaeon]|nr:hypothetical protein [Candidatus Micrarchaeota archaeon]
YQMFSSEYDATEEPLILKYWLEFNRRWFNKFNHNVSHSITFWKPCEKCKKMKTKNLLDEIKQPYYYIVHPYIGFFLFKKEIDRKNQFLYEINNPVPVIPIDEAKSILNKYDSLKKSHDELCKHFIEILKNSRQETFKYFLDLKKDADMLKKHIIEQRKLYLSYNIISPYIARTEQLIFLSSNASILSIGHNKELLAEAVKTLAQGVSKDLILQAEQDVRQQFFYVIKKIKDLAGTAEFEELKTLQSLVDKISDKKVLGGSSWWD